MSKKTDTPNNLYLKMQEIGFNEKESRVYIDLLSRTNPVGTSKIVSSTKLHGQSVYDALSLLEARGLAKHVIQNGRKKFSANSPKRLSAFVEEKQKIAEEVAHDLLSMVGKEHQQDFEIFQGEYSFVAREFDVLENVKGTEEWLIIGGSGDRFYDTMKKETFNEYESIRSEKNVTIRYIGSESQKDELERISAERKGFNFRVMKNFDKSVVNTVIRSGNVTLTTFSNPLLSYEVKNDEVVESYRNFFEALWTLSS